MKWGEGWNEDDVVPLVAKEEEANRGNEYYEGKESKLICSGGRLMKFELWEPFQELSNLDLGWRPHIPQSQIRGMSGTAKEVGHRVVGGVAIGTGGVIGPAYRLCQATA